MRDNEQEHDQRNHMEHRTTSAQLDEYEAKLQTLTDDELRDELADATSAFDEEPHATLAIGAITIEQARREAERRRT